jgi:predicted Zn-dependent protease
LLLFVYACVLPQSQLAWPIRDLVLVPGAQIDLIGPNQEILGTVSKLTMQKYLLAHFRISRAAGIQAELLIIAGAEPNAFATAVNGKPMIATNLAMLRMIDEDVAQFAFLIGHEAAHLAKNHGAQSRTRSSTLRAMSSVVGLGLGAAGVPAGGAIAGLAANLIDTAYSREEENEADAFGVAYVLAVGYDPQAAIRLHEKLLEVGKGPIIPFLDSHPSGQDRIDNIKRLIAATKSKPPVADAALHPPSP